jgi:serine/threonine protein kinase
MMSENRATIADSWNLTHGRSSVKRAIIVGIDSYQDAPLSGCVNDATNVADCLSMPEYGFGSTVILDAEASRAAILRQLHEAAHAEEPFGPGSTLLFYFAGHGQVVGQAGYLVTHDAQKWDPGISLADLAQVMESASRVFDHVISILDCCHSGSAFTWANSRPLASTDVEREVKSVNESRCVLAACRPEESAYEKDGRGEFTSILSDALLGDAVDWDGNVTLMSLYQFVVGKISNRKQTPVFKGDVAGTVVLGSDFTPREGRPIEKTELTKIIAKAQNFVDTYRNLEFSELTDWGTRIAGGSKRCSLELESIVGWFEETEVQFVDISRDPRWKDLKERLIDFRKHLADLSPGESTRFGTIISRIGEGAFGNVWSVQHDDGRLHAFKVFHGNEIHLGIKANRFSNGYTSMRKLAHPRIVKVYEMTKAPLGFIMDYIQGENLADTYIDRHGNAEAILRLIIEVCETVQYAHSQGVLHRDIKPQNIIVERDEDGGLTPFLTDFDLAYHETNRTLTTTAAEIGGVINYAAPEQFYAPNRARSERVDVFSLAQLMYFAIVGESPSAGSPVRNVQKLSQALSSWVDDRASEPLLELYSKASSKNPDERPEDVTTMLSALRKAEAFIQLASDSEDVLEIDFWRRVGQAYAGLKKYSADPEHMWTISISGQVEINCGFKRVYSRGSVDVQLEFSVTQNMPVPAFKSGKKARDKTNARLDKLLRRRFGHTVTRHNGHKGTYQVFVNVSDVKLHISGVTKVADVITTTVNGIENWES